jgi:hypothetical protein
VEQQQRESMVAGSDDVDGSSAGAVVARHLEVEVAHLGCWRARLRLHPNRQEEGLSSRRGVVFVSVGPKRIAMTGSTVNSVSGTWALVASRTILTRVFRRRTVSREHSTRAEDIVASPRVQPVTGR